MATALVILAVVVAALNEILLPLTFAAVLAVLFKPLAGTLTRRGLRPSLSAGVVVLGLLALIVVVVVATAQGVVDPAGSSRRWRCAPSRWCAERSADPRRPFRPPRQGGGRRWRTVAAP